MLTLTLIGAPEVRFNLAFFDQERKFYVAWKELHDKASFGKKFKIKPAQGASFEVDVMQIKHCVFEALEYVVPEVGTHEELKK